MLLGGICAGASAYALYKIPDVLDAKSDRQVIERLISEIKEKYGVEVDVPVDAGNILVGYAASEEAVGEEKRDVSSAFTFVARKTLEAVREELHLYPREYLHAIGLRKIVIGSRVSGAMGIMTEGTASPSGHIGLYVGPITDPRFMRVYGTFHHELGHLLHLKFITEFSKEWSQEKLSMIQISEKVANIAALIFVIYLDNHRRTYGAEKGVARGDEAFDTATQTKIMLIKKYIEQLYPAMNSEYWNDVTHGRITPDYWDKRKKTLKRE